MIRRLLWLLIWCGVNLAAKSQALFLGRPRPVSLRPLDEVKDQRIGRNKLQPAPDGHLCPARASRQLRIFPSFRFEAADGARAQVGLRF